MKVLLLLAFALTFISAQKYANLNYYNDNACSGELIRLISAEANTCFKAPRINSFFIALCDGSSATVSLSMCSDSSCSNCSVISFGSTTCNSGFKGSCDVAVPSSPFSSTVLTSIYNDASCGNSVGAMYESAGSCLRLGDTSSVTYQCSSSTLGSVSINTDTVTFYPSANDCTGTGAPVPLLSSCVADSGYSAKQLCSSTSFLTISTFVLLIAFFLI